MNTEWNKIEDSDPGWEGSDQHCLIVLENKWVTVAFFFCGSFGH